MQSIQQLLDLAPAVPPGIPGFLANTWLKATLLLSAAGLLALLLKKSPAATRHLIWGIGLSALLFLPLIPFVVPRLNVPVWTTTVGSPSSDLQQLEAAPDEPAPTALAVAADSGAGVPVPSSNKRALTNQDNASLPGGSSDEPIAIRSGAPLLLERRPHWEIILLLVWLVGALICLSRWMIGVFGAWKIVRRSRPVANSECLADLTDLSAALGLTRPLRLIQNDCESMPMTCGIIRPAIVLPISHAEWPPERRRVILLHELSHVKRRDCLVQAIAQIACAIYWLNPMVWLAGRRLRLESENACDDAVIGGGTKASAYAAHILEIARTFSTAHSSPRGALTIARASQLESRMAAILNPTRQNTHRGERLRSAVVSLGLLSVALGLAAMTPYSRTAATTAETRPGAPEPGADPQRAWTAPTAANDQRSSNDSATTQTGKPQSKDPAPPDQSKPVTPDDGRRPDGSKQTFEEKESTFLSQRLVESYSKSLSIESSTLDQDTKGSGQKAGSDAAVEALTGALKDKDAEVRSNAIWALSVSHGRIAQDALITALRDEDPRVRAQAAWGLGMHGDKKAVEPLISALKDPNPKVVSQAAWALGMRGDVRAVDGLKALLNNPNEHIRGQAAWALGMLLMKSGGGDGDGDENEEESDGEGNSAPAPRPHANPHPHAHVNLAPMFRRAN
jgi:beta-lactamase regulating signal transducer with metallopeptidase domain